MAPLYPWQAPEWRPLGSPRVVAGVRAAMHRWGGIFGRRQQGVLPPRETLTGRVLIGKLKYHIGAGVCPGERDMTVAICQDRLRMCAQPGDVVLFVSVPGPCAFFGCRTRGLAIDKPAQRLVLAAGVVSEMVAPWDYHAPHGPLCGSKAADRIYVAQVSCFNDKEHLARPTTAKRSTALLGPSRLATVRRVKTKQGPQWVVQYKGGKVIQYRLKKAARFHQTPGHVNAIDEEALRRTDFNAPVLRCQNFVMLPGQCKAPEAKVWPRRFDKHLGARFRVLSKAPKPLWDFVQSLWA